MKPVFPYILKRLTCLALVLFACLLSKAQQQFPYSVVIDTVVGDCFNNCQAVISLYDAQGNLIQTDDSLHHPVDSVAYPISNLQYHYKNQLHNSVFYSDSHILTMDVGTYDIGVSGYVMVPSGAGLVPVLVDTTLYGIVLTSTYTPMSVSMLAVIAQNDQLVNGVWRERYGNRHDLPCGKQGRVQMKITAGMFPYTVTFIDAQNDTVRQVVFDQPQHNGNDSTYADFRYYYTFDTLSAGTYRIEARDACSYTVVLHHTVLLNNISFNPPQSYQNNCSDSNTVKFRVNFSFQRGTFNYLNDYLASTFQYRFIHTDDTGHSDTTSWRPVNGTTIINSNYGIYCDTLGFAHRYCDLYGHSIKFEMRDLCSQNTKSQTVTISPPQITCNSSASENVFCLGEITLDTCARKCDSMLRTKTYSIWCNSNYIYYTCPPRWVYTDSATGQVIKTQTVSKLTSQTYSLSTLTSDDIENIYGPFSYLQLPIIRTLVDAKGCVLASRFDTLVFIRDTLPMLWPYSWTINSDYVNTTCYSGQKTITLSEINSPFPLFRDSTVVRLITSPLNNQYNFTATYTNGAWTIIKDDTVNNTSTITASSTNLNISVHDEHLAGGLYVFVCETPCGPDTLQITIGGYSYTTYEWIVDPAYQTWQECNDLLVKPVAGKYRRYRYYVNNGDTTVTHTDYTPNINLVSGVVGGYSTTSTSMNVPFRFTIPGDYVIRMSFTGCNETFSRIDTIHFVRIRVDFKKAFAVVCDSTANIGSVVARAYNGSEPYTYKLYSQPDLHGNLIGINQTGLFYNVPMQIGQELSIMVIDSCESSYFINIVAMSLEQSKLLWFDGIQPNPGLCVGDTVALMSLPIDSSCSCVWHGPENFTAIGEQIWYYAADTLSKGWLVVEQLNTGCPTAVKDSIYVNVLPLPQVVISTLDTVCAGDTVEVKITAFGADTVHFNLQHTFAGIQSSQTLSVSAQDTLSLFFPIETENSFWISQANDLYCTRNQHDTVQVTPYPVTLWADSTLITGEDLLICYGSDATLSVTSDITSECILNWYSHALLNIEIQQDTIQNTGEVSAYTIPELLTDTTLYVAVWSQENCPAHIERIDSWMNMQNGATEILPGQGVRFYDSGGAGHAYGNFETRTHTFSSPGVGLILVRFNSMALAAGDTLYLFADNDLLVHSYTGTQLPANLTLATHSVTFKFVSNQTNTAAGWSIDILTPSALTEVSAEVVRFFDTIATTICQTNEPFTLLPFSQIDISDTGLLQLDTTIASVMGCDSSISLTINVLPVKSSILDTIICEGFDLPMGGFNYTEEGTYLCHFTAENGCDSTVTLQLGVVEKETEVFSSEEDFCDHFHTILTIPYPADDYIWSTGDQTPFLEVTYPGIYTVTCLYQGCKMMAKYIIPTCEWELYLPNVITPGNSEHGNNVFCLQEEQKFWIEDFELYVFNRWGEIAYSSQDKNFKWDGSVNGQIYPNNVYNYLIRLTDKVGRHLFYKGSIVILM